MIELKPKSYGLKKYIEQTKEDTIIFRHGHIAISNYKMGDNKEFERYLSVFDELQWKYHMCGGYYVKPLKEFRVNRGFSVDLLFRFFPHHVPIVDNDCYPYDKIKVELYAPPRNDFQRVAISYMTGNEDFEKYKKFSQKILAADTGMGKAQPDDTMIPTPDGLKLLKNIEIGDTVYNKDGKEVAVIGIYPQIGLQDTYEIIFDDGRSTRCNIEHLWEISTNFQDKKVISTKELLSLWKKRSAYDYFSVDCPPLVEQEQEDTFGDPYTNGESYHKKAAYIPYSYQQNSSEIRRAFLKGFFATEDLEGDHEIISSTIEIQVILNMLYSLGYFVYVEKRPIGKLTKEEEYTKYKLEGENFIKEHPENIQLMIIKELIDLDIDYTISELPSYRYLLHIVDGKRKKGLRVKDIKLTQPSYQRCILIDDPSHIYLTEHYIPTHNTYCGIATTCYYEGRAVIIIPFSKLIEQWRDSFTTFSSVKEKEIMVVQGNKACEKIIDGKCEKIKVFIVMMDTIAAFEKSHGPLGVIDLFSSMNAKIKIVDEFHRDMRIINMIDALSNFKHNFYMSASPGRANKQENKIFKTMFYHTPQFGMDFKTQDEKHLNILVKKYYFVPTEKQKKRMINRKGWLNQKSYETTLIHSSIEQRYGFEKALLHMLEWSKDLLKEGNKIMILTATIEGTEYTQAIAEQVFPGRTAQYYGTMKKGKEEALEHDIICATASSLGTGADIKGIQHVYNCTTYANWIDAKQISGRARELSDGTEVVYIELVNYGFTKTVKQYEKRKPYLLERSKTNKIIVVE